jgi:serine/threonine protein kinase
LSIIEQYDSGVWSVESLIGEGSYGKVYKIVREEFGSKYESALKVIEVPQTKSEIGQLRSEGFDDVSVNTYFRAMVGDMIKEITFISKFKGTSHICCYEDHKIIPHPEGPGYSILIRMELLESLEKVVLHKKMGPAETAKLGAHICAALELLSAHNTLHRDIKPENIFLSPHGDYKLGDFGIAKQIDTSHLSKKGTFTYMAPEVFKDLSYGQSVDLYSLGIVMYRLLNKNRTPFLPNYPAQINPSDREAALNRRMGGEAIPFPVDADPVLGAIVLTACEFDQERRFKNATDMKKALNAYLRSLEEDDDLGSILPPVELTVRPRSFAFRKQGQGGAPIVPATGSVQPDPLDRTPGYLPDKKPAELGSIENSGEDSLKKSSSSSGVDSDKAAISATPDPTPQDSGDKGAVLHEAAKEEPLDDANESIKDKSAETSVKDVSYEGADSEDLESESADSEDLGDEGIDSEGIDPEDLEAEDLEAEGIDSEGADSESANSQASDYSAPIPISPELFASDQEGTIVDKDASAKRAALFKAELLARQGLGAGSKGSAPAEAAVDIKAEKETKAEKELKA